MAAVAQLTAARKDLAEAISPRVIRPYVQKLGKEVMRDSKGQGLHHDCRQGRQRGGPRPLGEGGRQRPEPAQREESPGGRGLHGGRGRDRGEVFPEGGRPGGPSATRSSGSVTTGVDLTPASHAFVEEVKKMFDVECTLFQGDMRATTTLMKDGQRVIGTKMDNPKVLKTVLSKGQRYLDINRILGKDYNTGLLAPEGCLGEGHRHALHRQGPVDRDHRGEEHGSGRSWRSLSSSGPSCWLAASWSRDPSRGPSTGRSPSLSEAAEQVVSASSQVSSASQSLADGAFQQAASFEETSSSLEEMSSMTKQNADNASRPTSS